MVLPFLLAMHCGGPAASSHPYPPAGPPGGPGCGLDSAAFCDTFDHPSTNKGRAGELDATLWSASRLQPQSPTYAGAAYPIGQATLPACRGGLPTRVLPDQDTLICDPTAEIHSNHLLVAAAAQNYGVNSYRVRRPFDFTGRTGKIVFDATGFTQQLLGWISLEITEDPIAAPSYAVLTNDEGGIIPQNAIELQFGWPCIGSAPQFSLGAVHVFNNYADTVYPASWPNPNPAPCMDIDPSKLNHFEVQLAKDKVSVWVSPTSADGVTFAPATLMFETPINLSFTRGYVHFSTHNHATLKYASNKGPCGSDSDCHTVGPNYRCGTDHTCELDSWVTRWDNIGFDGPVVPVAREYEIADALRARPDGTATNIGYLVADEASAPHDTLHFAGVDPTGATRARLAFSTWYPAPDNLPIAAYTIKLRLNGGAWHAHQLTSDEITAMTKPVVVGSDKSGSQGALGQILEVPITELVAGDNTVEFVSANIPQNYPPGIVNVDLILDAP